MANLTRRSVLAAGAAAGTGIAVAGGSSSAAATPLGKDPFTLGVASGDPDHEGFVLWTRLAREPLAEDGKGGMPDRPVPVLWEIAHDERFRRIARRGVALARPEWGHSVHVEVEHMRPDSWYWYRFRTGTYISPVGRTRTAPAPWQRGGTLIMAATSCSSMPQGYFSAYGALAADEPDLVLNLGDYQYEYPSVPTDFRQIQGPETVTLANYRQRYAEYKTDPDLRAAHAAAPWVLVWDDHEIENNWAGPNPEAKTPTPPGPAFEQRRRDAARAYYENLPLRRSSLPSGTDIQLYRRLQWGRLALFHMLDTRQFRSDQACGDGWKADCAGASDPTRTITGPEQEQWLLDGLRRSGATWDILGQQVFFAQRDGDEGPVKYTSMDAWDGYLASRDRLVRAWQDLKVRNPVVLTGDVHTAWANDLKADFDDPSSATVGSELVATSVTSGGDGFDSDPSTNPTLAINPHLKFYNSQRGYLRTAITQDEITADFRVVPFVSRPGATPHTRATFVIEEGAPGVNQTYDRPLDPKTQADPWPLAPEDKPLPEVPRGF